MTYMPQLESPLLCGRRRCRRWRDLRSAFRNPGRQLQVVRAADGSPEVNAWVVIKP